MTLTLALGFMAALFAVHEAGHMLMAACFGIRPTRLVTNGWGLGIELRGRDPHALLSRRRDLAITSAGPEASFAMAEVLWVAGTHDLAIMAGIFAVLNLVLPGGDGHRIYRTLRAHHADRH